MPATSRLVILYCVSKNRQYVKSVFVSLSTLSRGLQCIFRMCNNDTNYPIQGAIWTLSLQRSPWNSKISVLTTSVIKSCDSWLKWLISPDFSKSFSNTFLFGFSNCSINRPTVSLRFVSTCSTVEWTAWDSKIYTTTATGPPVLMNFVLTIIGFSRIRDKYILLSVVASSARVLRKVAWVTDTLEVEFFITSFHAYHFFSSNRW